MSSRTLRIATRQSPMAQWQANTIAQQLQHTHPDLCIDIVGLTTTGDRFTDRALKDIGGKDLFVKELQRALLQNEADMAVHCIKDMSVRAVPNLSLEAICQRDDPRDALVSNQYHLLSDLPDGAIIGTASPRRQCLLAKYAPQVECKLIRGNLNTRLKKLDDGEYDAILVAKAGIDRLQFEDRLREIFSTDTFIPAIAQGTLGIECRDDDHWVKEKIAFLHDNDTAICIHAERAFNRRLQGDCHTPIGAYATIENQHVSMHTFVGNITTQQMWFAKGTKPLDQADALGFELANEVLNQGASF